MSTELIPTNDELNVYQVMAKTATQSQLFGKIGGEAGLLTIMLMARELGISPMVALMGGINIIQGKAEVSPRLMNSMIRKAGHKIEILESTDAKCTIRGTRHDTKEAYTCSFTIDDARRAGLIRSGGGYEKWASDMLFARCLSRLARRLFADIISTAYVEGEIDRAEEWETLKSEAVVETAVIPTVKDLTEEDFLLKMADYLPEPQDTVFLNSLEEYLQTLATDKVPVQKVMKQALRDKGMSTRFCNSWVNWYDAKKDAKAQIIEQAPSL